MKRFSDGFATDPQVLISIQSMILISDPYFNEPGFESSMTTTAGKEQSRAYNENLRCVGALLQALLSYVMVARRGGLGVANLAA